MSLDRTLVLPTDESSSFSHPDLIDKLHHEWQQELNPAYFQNSELNSALAQSQQYALDHAYIKAPPCVDLSHTALNLAMESGFAATAGSLLLKDIIARRPFSLAFDMAVLTSSLCAGYKDYEILAQPYAPMVPVPPRL